MEKILHSLAAAAGATVGFGIASKVGLVKKNTISKTNEYTILFVGVFLGSYVLSDLIGEDVKLFL